MNESNINAIRAALLFMTEKYRQIEMRADLFDDGAISDAAATTGRSALRMLATLDADGIVNTNDAAYATVALTALTDNMNRQMQLLNGRGQINDAAIIEHRIREVYAAMAAVDLVARGLRTDSVSTSA
jgi:hypothetical protein